MIFPRQIDKRFAFDAENFLSFEEAPQPAVRKAMMLSVNGINLAISTREKDGRLLRHIDVGIGRKASEKKTFFKVF